MKIVFNEIVKEETFYMRSHVIIDGETSEADFIRRGKDEWFQSLGESTEHKVFDKESYELLEKSFQEQKKGNWIRKVK